MSESSLLISRFQVRVLSGSPDDTSPSNGQHTMPATIVTWAFAPEWLTPADAASLMGPAYSADAIVTLIEIGGIVAEPSPDGLLIEKRSLKEYQESLWELTP